MTDLARMTELAMKLSLGDRLELAWRLRESVNPDAARVEFETELQRRSDDLSSGRVQGIPHEEVMRELRAKFGDSQESRS